VDQGIRNSKNRTAFISTKSDSWPAVMLGQKARQPPELRGSQPPFTEGAGHSIPEEQPDRVTQLMIAFFRKANLLS
jgi:pimeloyl-ACP methyl ester carboxylesterase